jgi:hypothetical protein|tara:strand:+ start:190 stop:507 length:318 start_codon:yes stop_codon:yes gene_type:complete
MPRLVSVVLSALLVIGALVATASLLNNDDESEKWTLLEEAVSLVEKKLLTLSTEMERKELGLDVDYLFEKLDAIEIKSTQSAKKEKRKALINRVNKVAETLDKRT